MNKENRMNESNDQSGGLHRRDLLKGAAAAGLALTMGSLSGAAAGAEDNLIVRENAKPGTRDWMLAKTRIDPETNWRCPWIEGYCSAMSVRAGDTLKIMVSTNPVSNFSLEIFRTGYYGGTGGRLVKQFDSLKGKIQSDPPIGENRLRECQWETSAEITIPNDWLSGVYLGKLTAEKEGLQSYVIFIVRDDRPCDFLFQCSDLTWTAYNRWPDSWSLYDDGKVKYFKDGKRQWHVGPDSGLVSLDRPYGKFCIPHMNDSPLALGSGEYLLWEFPLSFWMEQHGYDVSYISNVDTHADGAGLLRAKGFLSVGHDEYWTRDMYDHVSAARDAGVNLAFLSGNSVFGVVPLLPSTDERPHRIIRRENWFYTEEFSEALQKNYGFRFEYPPGPDAGLLMGGRMAGVGRGDWVCTNPEHWIHEGTGMKMGEAIEGLVGWEWHGFPVHDLPGF